MTSLLQMSNPAHRRLGLSILIGIVAGVVGAFAKWGWEVPFPPRNPNIFWPLGAMERVTPPKVFLDMLGLPSDWSYTFSGVVQPLSVFIVHIGFSVSFALVYCVAAEYFPKIKLGWGMVYGFAVYFGAHCVVMPFMGLVPPVFQIPFDEQISELFGHLWWLWLMEIVRHDLRYRLTGFANVEDEDAHGRPAY